MRIYSKTSADEVKSKTMNTFVQLSGIKKDDKNSEDSLLELFLKLNENK